jgi:dihydrofolate reductase
MARIVFGLQQSLDGYVDHQRLGPPGPVAFRHFAEHVRGLAGIVYGARTYEIMRYWDEDQPGWNDMDREYAEIWRSKPKWVVSRSLTSVGPGAALVEGDLEAAIRALRARHDGEIDVAGPDMARSLGELRLIDEYRLYLRPLVLAGGAPFFAGARPSLRFAGSDLIGEGMVRLTYVPA